MVKKQKKDLNEVIGTVLVITIWTIFFVVLIGSAILWVQTGSSFYIISGLIGAAGVGTQLFIGHRERYGNRIDTDEADRKTSSFDE